MRLSEIKLRFPVIGFSPDQDVWGFPDRRSLTTCGPRALRSQMHRGLEIIDARGRRHLVRSVTRVGRAGSFTSWFIMALLTAKPQSKIELELEALSPIDLAEVKERVCIAIAAHPLFYCNPTEQAEAIPALMGQIRSKRSFEAVHNALGLDSLEAY